MGSLEILAAFVAVLILIKLLVVFVINPKKWLKVGEALLKQSAITLPIYIILAVLVGYYVFSLIGIVEFLAAALLMSILLGMGFLPFSKEYLAFARKLSGRTKTELWAKCWLQVLIWLALAVWGLYTVFS